jgi:two-component system cell cycle sensor histidine kinase/response regulator CckA
MSPRRRRPSTHRGSKSEVTEREQAAQLQAATYRISEAANAAEDLPQLFRAVHDIISELMPAKNLYIALYDTDAGILSFPYWVDEHDPPPARHKLERGLTEYVLRTGQPLLATPEVHEELSRRGEADLVGAPSLDWIGVPLKAHDRTIGVLVSQTYTEGIRFGEREKDILQFVSTQVAMAIERKRAEEAVRASEARLKALLDSALDACVTMDETGRITSWSAAAETVFGWPVSEAIGRSLADTIIPSHHREGHARGLARFLETGEGPILRQRIEITALHRDGREFPVELTVTPIRLGDHWLFGAFVRDLTEEKRAELALQREVREREAAERLLRQVIDADPSLVFVKDRDGKFVLVNKAVADIYGTTVEAQVGKTDADFNPNQQEVEHFLRDDRAVMDSRRPKVVTEEAVTNPTTGATRWFQTVKVPLLSPDGEARRVLGVATDITERKRAEEALRRSEASYRGLVEHAAYGIYRATADGEFLMVNPALFRMLGYPSAEDLLKLNVGRDAYVDPAARARIVARCEQFGSAIEEVAWRRRDGGVITVRLSGRPVRGPDGAIECFEFIVEDVTEQRALEERLRQTQKMEAVGRLAGGIAHDFNNLLTAILGSVDFLRRALGPEHPEHAETEEIQKAAVRAADLTRQLLAFSRQQVLAPKVLELDALVTNLEKMLRRLIGEDVEWRFVPKAARAAVRADPGQLEQVIVNLVVNARDAMPRGGKLTIETATVDLDAAYAWEHGTVEPGRYVMLAVTDTGVGIDRAARARLFEPFFTTKEFGKGTGLGLATVYGIVKQSGGYIWVYSEPGQGATFKVYLPRVEPAGEPVAARPSPARALGGTEIILLAEDEAAVRNLARRVLEKHGYKLLLAATGRDGVQLATQHAGPIDLLVTDVVMPEMGGRELAQRLTALQPGLKVLYLSGYTDDMIVRHGVLEAGVAFLQKPFTPDTLLRKIREVLDGTQ